MKKHLAWFPFLLLALTIVLAATIVLVDRGRNAPPTVVVVDETLETEEVFPEEKRRAYYASVQKAAEPIFRAAETDEGDVVAVRRAREELLGMTVPGDERDAHIRLIAAANKLIDGLEGDAEAFADGQLRVKQLYDVLVWLK